MADTNSSRILQYAIDSCQLTQTRLAEVLLVDQSLVSQILHGKRRLTLKRICILAQASELPVRVLFWVALRPATDDPKKKAALAKVDSLLAGLYPLAFAPSGAATK